MTKDKAARAGVTYEVKADPAGSQWIVLRGGKPTGGFGPNLHQAVNAAIGEAKHEARESHLKVRVISVVGVNRNEEWASPACFQI